LSVGSQKWLAVRQNGWRPLCLQPDRHRDPPPDLMWRL